MYHSYAEILNQSEALKNTWAAVMAAREGIVNWLEGGQDIVIVACGSSYWASLSAAQTLGRTLKTNAWALKAGDLVMHPTLYEGRFRRPLILAPSRSGSTSEQLKAIQVLKQLYPEAKVLSFVVYGDSRLAGLSDLSVHLPWPRETSVCQTRSFNCLYLAMAAVAALKDQQLAQGLQAFLEDFDRLAHDGMVRMERVCGRFSQVSSLVAIGSGVQYGLVIEGAYIAIEMAQMPGNYYQVLELRHGPIVTVGKQTLVALCSAGGEATRLEEQMLKEAAAEGAATLAVGYEGFAEADEAFHLPQGWPQEAVALYFVFLMQAYAYYKALQSGLDPDKPGDLIPFITIDV